MQYFAKRNQATGVIRRDFPLLTCHLLVGVGLFSAEEGHLRLLADLVVQV